MTSSTVAYFMFLNVRIRLPVLFSERNDDGPDYLSRFMLVVWWAIYPS